MARAAWRCPAVAMWCWWLFRGLSMCGEGDGRSRPGESRGGWVISGVDVPVRAGLLTARASLLPARTPPAPARGAGRHGPGPTGSARGPMAQVVPCGQPARWTLSQARPVKPPAWLPPIGGRHLRPGCPPRIAQVPSPHPSPPSPSFPCPVPSSRPSPGSSRRVRGSHPRAPTATPRCSPRTRPDEPRRPGLRRGSDPRSRPRPRGPGPARRCA